MPEGNIEGWRMRSIGVMCTWPVHVCRFVRVPQRDEVAIQSGISGRKILYDGIFVVNGVNRG